MLTTGGTGPALRDVTPEATLAVAHKLMPGFGEQMRQISLNFVPTAILSRQVGVIRGKSLILNLPGQPKSIAETLQGLPQAIAQIGRRQLLMRQFELQRPQREVHVADKREHGSDQAEQRHAEHHGDEPGPEDCRRALE